MTTPENSKHNTNIYAHTGEKPKRENKKKRQIEAGKAGLQDCRSHDTNISSNRSSYHKEFTDESQPTDSVCTDFLSRDVTKASARNAS